MSSFKTLLANLFLLTLLHHCQSLENSEENQQQPTFPHNSLNEPEELDIGEHPYLWQMAAFAARQLSNKESKVKLVTLTNAEKLDSTYRLRVTLQRVSRGNTPVDQSNELYCTVEVETNADQWSVGNVGCTAPALVRTRKPKNLAAPPVVAKDSSKPIDNNIITEPQQPGTLFTQPKYHRKQQLVKRQIYTRMPYFYRMNYPVYHYYYV